MHQPKIDAPSISERSQEVVRPTAHEAKIVAEPPIRSPTPAYQPVVEPPPVHDRPPVVEMRPQRADKVIAEPVSSVPLHHPPAEPPAHEKKAK
ncbi:MAG: hypothetical protein ABL933_16200, partial [Methyloglobulus sp.]